MHERLTTTNNDSADVNNAPETDARELTTHAGVSPAPAAAMAEETAEPIEQTTLADLLDQVTAEETIRPDVWQADETPSSDAGAAPEASADETASADVPAASADDAVALPGSADEPQHAPVETPAPAVDPTTTHASAIAAANQHAEGGIEILIQMAEKGEIDPKNIDIIDVTDRFLKAISAVPKENLRQSGKIIFQASILLRMKAEALLARKVEEESYGDDFLDFDADGSPIIFDSNQEAVARQITLQDLERALVRQTKVRQLRHRRVTLEQLIEALREAERLEKNRTERKIKPQIVVDGYNEMRDMDDILDLAHDEDIEDVIARIESLLSDLLAADDLLPLLQIVKALGGRGDWVDAFLAVLFLSNAGKISLKQDQMYGPLFVIRPDSDPAAATVIPPVVAESGPTVTH